MDEQYSFCPGRSTTVSTITFFNYIFEVFNARSQVDVIFPGFSKTFDKVNNNLLIRILREFGFGEPLSPCFIFH